MAVKRKTKPAKSAEPRLSGEALKRCYADMLLIRRFEERAGEMYGMGLIGGVCPFYIGHEGGGVRIQPALPVGEDGVHPHRQPGRYDGCRHSHPGRPALRARGRL